MLQKDMDKLKHVNNPLITLTKGQRVIYDLLFDAMQNGKQDVILPTIVNSDNIIYYIKLVIAENPELCNYDACSCSFAQQGRKTIVRLNQAFQNSRMGYSLQRKAEQIIDEIIDVKVSDIKKVLAIHDYFIKHVTYKESYSSVSYVSHTAYGAIIENEAVCEGIAYGFSYLLKRVGIKSTVVDGEADGGGHAWNIVKIGAECYHFDVTWDLLRQNESHNMIYDYFCLSDQDLKNRIWDRKIYPKCKSRQYNYFIISKSFAHNDKDLIKIIERQFPKYKAIYLRYDFVSSSKETAIEYLWNVFLKVAQRNRWNYGSVRYSLNEDQSIFSLYECG